MPWHVLVDKQAKAVYGRVEFALAFQADRQAPHYLHVGQLLVQIVFHSSIFHLIARPQAQFEEDFRLIERPDVDQGEAHADHGTQPEELFIRAAIRERDPSDDVVQDRQRFVRTTEFRQNVAEFDIQHDREQLVGWMSRVSTHLAEFTQRCFMASAPRQGRSDIEPG